MIKDDYDLLNYENQGGNVRKLIKSQAFSFFEVAIEDLMKSGFLRECEWRLSHDVGHESGWRRSLLIHQLFNETLNAKFELY